MSINVYQDIGRDSEVMVASPHRLVQLLFEQLLLDLNTSLLMIKTQNMGGEMKYITRAKRIVVYLHQCLNMENGGDISEQLDRYYTYVEKKLLIAYVKQNEQALNESIRVITSIKDGWDGIAHVV